MTSARSNGILGTGSVVLTAAYPLAVYFLVDRGGIRLAGLALLVALIGRFLLPGTLQLRYVLLLVAGIGFAAAIALTNSETLARLYPVGVSAALLAAFGATLARPPSMVERFARAGGSALDAPGIRYTRAVTIAWCGFFLVNGAIALATALGGTREAWALYNGLISYLVAGALFFGERLLRPVVLRRQATGAAP